MKEIFMGTGMRLAVATALVCGVTLGGVTLFSDSGGSLSNGVDYTPAQTVFRGSAPHVSATSSAPRTNMSVVAHPTIHLSGSGTSSGAAAASSASASGSSLYTSASSQSVGSSAAPLVTFSDGSNGGGVYVSGSGGGGGGGVAISSGGGGHSSGAISSAGSGGGAAVIAPKRFGSQSNNDIFSGLTVYDGDKPGEITGTENEVTENTIVTSYGQPIGDALLPLLLMTIIYLIIKRKTMKQLMHTLLRSQHHHAGLLTLCALLLLPCTRAWAGQETITYKDVQGNDSAVTYNVVYLNSTTGDDGNDGSSSAPVKTLAKAYSKLPAFNTATDDRDAAWDSNIIVVAGSVTLDKNVNESATGNRPATITGVWPWNATNTTVTKVDGGGRLTLSGVNSGGRIGADTKFKYVKFSNAGCLSLYLHDCTFDVGCLMNGAGELPTSNGALSNRKTANIQLFLLADPYAFTETPDGGWSNIMKKPVTLTMRSGKFGRILCTRITGTKDAEVKARYVVGNPEKPLLAVINVDMDPSTTEGDWNKGSYVDDIAFLCAGTTQGTVYADVQMNIKRGKISSLVAGSQGNAIAACEGAGVPTSTYIGRTTVNLIGKTDADVQIYRYFGGCLGRLTGDGASGECKAYFYGKSILNLTHGTIERDLYASAGGLSGLKNPNNDTQYTTDTRIPYQGGSKPNYPYMGIDYSAYSASKTIVSVKSDLYGAQDIINLAESKITFNINGGIIKGNVYGGSYGYSEDMTAGAAPTGAGSLWGNTEVNISGGTIQGSVYAGGGGTTEYYTKSTSNEMRAKYLDVATVYGNTNLTITGAPNIAGNIYGGGAGVASTGAVGTDTEFLNIGKVYGNTNVTIDADADWEFTGNIYGGGAKGAVEGNTNVTILGGIINGKVFGAGQGEEGHPDKAKVTGTTNVVVGTTPAP